MAHQPDQVRVTLSRETVQHLLHYQGDEILGRDGGHYVNRLIHLVKAADDVERAWIAERHPEIVAGVVLLMRVHWALEWMRDLAKKYEAGVDLEASTDVLDIAVLSGVKL